MKLGILGNGMIVRDLMNTIHRLKLEKIYIMGREASREKIEQLVSGNHLTGSFYHYEELLKTDVDVIYVALPNHLHYEYARKALEYKKHVIIEKPAVSGAKELQELAELAGKQNRMLFEAMNIHYLPAFQALKEDLATLGKNRPLFECIVPGGIL